MAVHILNLRALEKQYKWFFLGKQNTTLYSIYHHKGGVGVLWAALRAKNPESKSHRFMEAKKKPRMGSRNQEKKENEKKKFVSAPKENQKNVQSNVNNQGYNNRYKKHSYIHLWVPG